MEINKSYNMLYAYQKTNEYSNTNSTTVSKAATGATEISQGVIYERKSASTVEYCELPVRFLTQSKLHV